MNDKKYIGIGLIGNEHVSGIYTVNNGIVDINGTGIYHLFYKNYDHDIMQSANTAIQVEDKIYYGNRQWSLNTHPIHLKPEESNLNEGFIYEDIFDIKEKYFKKIDRIYAYGESNIVFETEIINYGDFEIDCSLYAYAAIRNDYKIDSEKLDKNVISTNTNKVNICMVSDDAEEQYIVEDSPTDFSYQTFQEIFNNEKTPKNLSTYCRVGLAQGRKKIIKAKEKFIFRWALVFSDSVNQSKILLENLNLSNSKENAIEYWNKWLKKGEDNYKPVIKNVNSEFNILIEELKDLARANLIAIKSVLLNGNIPADLTGHYFANKMPCYYARDSIMVAKAFLNSGHYEECEEILKYLINRKRKDNGEFFQRYDGKGEPNEGANNDVFHQIDSIGYFCKIIYDLFKKTGKLIVDLNFIKELVNVIKTSEKKNGMVGPEGGVNEGVFGPAFITSSNMFIYGGIDAAGKLFEEFNDLEYKILCEKICKDIYSGIQTTFDPTLQRYNYGYVNYRESIVRKYDTPQYFGVLYGYPNDEYMKLTHKYFIKNASFFEDGIGYSEQEYHHGPWIFNTAACAQYSALNGDLENYIKKLKWISKHMNAYGLAPEAIDANDENICFINPLTWACAEFVSSYYIIRGEI